MSRWSDEPATGPSVVVSWAGPLPVLLGTLLRMR